MTLQAASNCELFVVDDDESSRDLLSVIFTLAGFRFSGFSNAESFFTAMRTREPACVLLDVHLTRGSGIDILRRLKARNYTGPVFMISGDGDVALAVEAVKSGAFDYIVKPFEGPNVITRVSQAIADFARLAAAGVAQDNAPRAFPGQDLLTPREREVLAQIAGGASNKEAGRRLGISPRTIEVHRARIMDKLGAKNAADLVRIVLGGASDRNGTSRSETSELVA